MTARFDQARLEQILSSLTKRCRALIDTDDHIVGIRRGGVLLAQFLNQKLNRPRPVGELDVNFYRDDLGHRQRRKIVAPSVNLPDLDGGRVVLVDDVLWTGRTVRAALNELFDYGRPERIALVVLFDRGGRELPIEASIAGDTIELSGHQQIKLCQEQGRLYAEIFEFSQAPADGHAQTL